MFELTSFETEALYLSLKISLWAVAAGLIPGIGIAYLLARKSFPGKLLLDGLVHIPLVIPPVVTGYILLIVFNDNGPGGKLLTSIFGTGIAFSWRGAVLASAVMAFPLLVRSVRLSIESVDKGLEEASRTLGAGRLRVFFTITLPLSVPGVITGTVLAFARSLGEFGATITFVSNIPGETSTLPLALFNLTQTPGTEYEAMKLCIISILLALIAIAASEFFSRRAASRLRGDNA
ncbi:molybdate ABC transporter, inner membrane subunit [Denitrovibrio acetiphilus DSM 12809]|uniref:Molybdenum transport system permease n=1 Tax=Denitrovibrio acetiphilus (strain DSM 12809 / NBRC 114555 / N2460) TaxID=522772 RepID=D4H8Q5_DENA2|nr:molybdate ABC transporter permease subunit [Denitrovibrio acetiphilus]ADD68404.1 molybdate ABC transporter, inner membrane subunit [Denitrovibrio acetiphilus DSM 12809]